MAKKSSRSLILIIILVCIFACVGYKIVSQQITMIEYNAESDELDSKIAKAKEESKELDKQKKEVNSPEYIEKIAREELDYGASDEIIFKDSTAQK